MLVYEALRAMKLQHLNAAMLAHLHLQLQNYLASLPIEAETDQVNKILQAKIQIEKEMLEQERIPLRKGRGGNNIAENIKKSFLSSLKKTLPTHLYEQMNERFIKQYKVKSQKQNLVLFFLFLEILFHQRKIERKIIVELIFSMKDKMEKYIHNSKKKLEREQQRKQFHEKNIAQFKKFLALDLDFAKERDFQGMIEQIGSFYLRKKMELAKAQKKIRKIVDDFFCLKGIFYDSSKSQEQEQRKNDQLQKNSELRCKNIQKEEKKQ